MIRVPAIIVNYNCAAYTAACVRSLLAQRFTGMDGRPGRVAVIVVDNASPREGEGERLAEIERLGATVLRNDRNAGYSGGLAAGLALAEGDPVFVVNPDVLLFPGCLEHLYRALLDDPRAAASAPLGWWDPHRELRLPPNLPAPTLGDFCVQSMGLLSRAVGRRYSLRRSRLAVAYWRREETAPCPMLSGSCLLIRREAIERIGFFDERFPLYYEDTDWFFRVMRAGWRLLHVPRAEMVHFYSRSASTDQAEALRRYHRSQEEFFAKHYGRAGLQVARAVKIATQGLGKGLRGWDFASCEDLGERTEPPELHASGARGAVVFELGTSPSFVLTAGTFPEGNSYVMSSATWSVLEPISYWCRFVDLTTFRILGTWTFRKSVPAAGLDALEAEFRAGERVGARR